MSSNSNNDDFPTIRLDDEDRQQYQQKKQITGSKPQKATPSTKKTAKQSGFPITATLAVLIACAASGAAYYLYDQSLKQAEILSSAENRILQLERKLSATDEEMGESTVALQVKVTELSEKTGELWEQMDKLWASAWRRNQKEIADLGALLTKTANGLEESIGQVRRNGETQRVKVASFESQLATIADELLALNVQLEQTANAEQQAIQRNKVLEEKIATVEQRNTKLTQRITQLESEIKAMATKLVSSPPASL
jgi:chromosome segregation ATPase